ncbi:hypothetical protein [Bradyrhizobium sp. LB11.1]|uniref:hypothetical protein n=1 Tax=Bradyrhizobium sp. LB11.1 TaxID=3156326 RepID=UPI0033987686
MNDQKVHRIKFVVVPEHLADRKQHIGQRVSRDRPNDIRSIAHESETNIHLVDEGSSERIIRHTQIEYVTTCLRSSTSHCDVGGRADR